MIQPGDEILIIAKVEAVHGRDLLVNVAGHNIQISSDHGIARQNGEPLVRPAIPDGSSYVIGEDFHLGPRYDSDDMHRDYPNLGATDA